MNRLSLFAHHAMVGFTAFVQPPGLPGRRVETPMHTDFRFDAFKEALA
jgi:hypothetical protein